MTNCAVIGCGSSTYHLKKWKELYCDTHLCNFGTARCICDPPFALFPFPTERRDPAGRKLWIKAVNRKDEQSGKNWEPKCQSRICSKHFVGGKPSDKYPAPTINLGYAVRKEVKGRALPQRHEVPTKKNCQKQCSESTSDNEITDLLESPEISVTPPPPDKTQILNEHNYGTMCSCSGCAEKQITINNLTQRIAELENQLQTATNEKQKKSPSPRKDDLNLNLNKLLKKDKQIRHYLGLPNKQVLESLIAYFTPMARTMSYWRGSAKVVSSKRQFKKTPQKSGPKKKLSVKAELVLVLLKLRMALSNEFLADLFGISVSVCSNVINTWLKLLSSELKSLVYWPPKEEVQETLPQSFKKHMSRVRCILDCSEVFIQRPRNHELQALTWSDYKKHNTLKFLVGIAPNGQITFLSKAWGGRTSDVHITEESGFLDLVDPTDEIMADRGFPIQEALLLRRAKLVIPPGARGSEQMTTADVQKTKHVANLRIHVERAINRIKWFKILSGTLAIKLVPLADDILTVCAALSNLQKPLVI